MAAVMNHITERLSNFAQHLGCRYFNLHPDSKWPAKRNEFSDQSILFPTGTLAAGVWQPGEDIRIVIMTSSDKYAVW